MKKNNKSQLALHLGITPVAVFNWSTERQDIYMSWWNAKCDNLPLKNHETNILNYHIKNDKILSKVFNSGTW